MFTDEFYDKEDNSKIFDFLIKLFLTEEVQFEPTEEETVAYKQDYPTVPDIA